MEKLQVLQQDGGWGQQQLTRQSALKLVLGLDQEHLGWLSWPTPSKPIPLSLIAIHHPDVVFQEGKIKTLQKLKEKLLDLQQVSRKN